MQINFKEVISSYFRGLFLFDDKIINKVLTYMFVKNQCCLEKICIDSDDIVDFNKMIYFLSDYNKGNVVDDFKNYVSKLNCKYIIEFYIYFLYLLNQFCFDNVMFNLNFKINIKELFYLFDVEALFNQEKFRAHYKSYYIDNKFVDGDLNNEIVSFIDKKISKGNLNNLEKAIMIYYLLCKKLRYDPEYVVFRDLDRTSKIEDINFGNNKVVCVHFAVIYYKLLKMYGVDCNLAGDKKHMYVNLRIGSMMLIADASRYGYFDVDYTLSDLTSAKYDFLVDGLYVDGSNYSDINYIKYNREKLNKVIKDVYRKMGIKLSNREKFNKLLNKYQEVELSKDEVVTKEVMDERINFFNCVFYPVNSEVEDVQMLTKLMKMIFADIEEDRLEDILLYRKVNGEVELNYLIVLYDEEMKPYYYLYNNGNYVNCDVNSVVSFILDGGWLFKNQNSVDALYLDDEKVQKLCLSMNDSI